MLRDDDAVPCLVILRSSGSTQHLHPWKRLWCWWSASVFILFIGSTKHIASHYDIDNTAACREFTESDTKAAKIMRFTCEPVRTSANQWHVHGRQLIPLALLWVVHLTSHGSHGSHGLDQLFPENSDPQNLPGFL